MSYSFVFNKKDGWWLKITTIEQLMEYWNEYNSILDTSLSHIRQTKEFGRGMEHADAIDMLLGFYAKAHKLSFDDAKNALLSDLRKSQYRALNDYGCIYVNSKHGWNYVDRPTEQFVCKNELIFPNFQTGKVKIEKFPLGNHFYIYVDGIQIRDGDTVKWNTIEDAKEFCRNRLGVIA